MASRCVREEYGKGHTYAIDGARVPGVTTVLRTAIDKPGLRVWYARQAVLWALQEGEERLKAMPDQQLMQLAGKAPDLVRDKAAREGTKLHAYAEALGSGEEIEPESELAARAELVADFLDRHRVKVLAAEVTVWHETLRYAGTLDVLADCWVNGRWMRLLLDYKTGAGVYEDNVLQLAAYRYATHAVIDGEDVPMAEVDGCAVVHVRPGGWELLPVVADERAFEAFSHAVAMHRFLATPLKELVKPAMAKPALLDELEGSEA
jgi:hypothetical protein